VSDIHVVLEQPVRHAIGNDRASSLRVQPGTFVALYSDVQYGGTCQEFPWDVPSLIGSAVGNDSVSSIQLSTTPGLCTHLEIPWSVQV
jgi:hypothetical protein